MKSNKELATQCGLSVSRIAQIKDILKSFKGIDFKVSKETKVIEFESSFNSWERKIDGIKLEADIYSIETKHGNYKVSVPKVSDLNKEYLDFFGFDTNKKTGAKFATFEIDILPLLKEASKYVLSKKDYNFKFHRVCLDFNGGNVAIVATDAKILYLKEFKCEHEYNYQMFIDVDTIKELARIKQPIKAIELLSKFNSHTTGDDAKNTFVINGVVFDEEWTTFVPYRNVIPNESQFMRFEAKKMLQCVDSVKGCANPISNVINFHLNGSIQATATDIDWGKEAKNSVDYISKNFPDLDIKFNYKQLTQAIKTFKCNELDMYIESSYKGALLTDGDTKVLVMPCM